VKSHGTQEFWDCVNGKSGNTDVLGGGDTEQADSASEPTKQVWPSIPHFTKEEDIVEHL
jgi:hypothetical protein